MKPDQAALAKRYRQQREEARFTLILGALSIALLLFYYAKQELLLYGDAVAHINIARRVVDNRHPLESYGQLGTVWLPLQHVAMLPFVWIDALWRSGIAGSIPSMVAYVLGTLGIFRLVSARAPKLAAYVAAAIYALNPNLLYMQTTAMNEPIFLAFFIWTLVYLDEFLRATSPQAIDPHAMPARMKPERALEACGMTLAGGAYTRYDGWFVAAIVVVVILCIFARWWRREENSAQRSAMTKSLIEVLVLNALVPVYWFVYTYCVSGYGLDFLNGPYSAKAIALRTTVHGAQPYPGQHDLFTAALYFLKSAKLNMGAGLLGTSALALALAGTVAAVWKFRRYGVFLLLWLPLPFYALSIAYGSVPIYLPVWYPFSYYNVRYGLELLPVFAVFPAILGRSRGGTHEQEGYPDRAVGDPNRDRCWQLCIGVSRNSDHVAGGASEFPRTHRDGASAGQCSRGIAALGHAADVWSRASWSAAAGRDSVAPRYFRRRASRLGLGAARSGAPCGLHSCLRGRSGVGGGTISTRRIDGAVVHQRSGPIALHDLQARATVGHGFIASFGNLPA